MLRILALMIVCCCLPLAAQHDHKEHTHGKAGEHSHDHASDDGHKHGSEDHTHDGKDSDHGHAHGDHSHGDHGHGAPESPHPTKELPPKLRELLRQEMRLLEKAIGDTASSIARNDLKATAETARKMRDSFILMKSLEKADMDALHAKLPMGFLKADQTFHATAGKMAEAAGSGNAALASRYHARLLQQCVGCHAAYAKGLVPPPE